MRAARASRSVTVQPVAAREMRIRLAQVAAAVDAERTLLYLSRPWPLGAAHDPFIREKVLLIGH